MSTLKTYLDSMEVAYPFCILRHDEPSPDAQAYADEHGMDLDTWSLIWSFRKKEDAVRCLKDERKTAGRFQTFRLITTS